MLYGLRILCRYLRSQVPVHLVLVLHVTSTVTYRTFTVVYIVGFLISAESAVLGIVWRGAGRHRRSPTPVLCWPSVAGVLIRRKAWVGDWKSRKGKIQLKDGLGGCSGEEEGVEVEPTTLQSRPGTRDNISRGYVMDAFCPSP